MRQTHDLICTECARVLEAGHKRCPVDGAKVIRRPRAAPGSVLAKRYRLDAVLGRGGWATVFRARDLTDNRDVAVKVLAPELRGSEHSVQRFIEEARTLAQIHHPNVVSVYDCGQSGTSVFMVLELLEGKALSETIVREAPLDSRRAVRIALQICDGLGAAHDRGVVHRDLKPDNVLLVGGAGDVYAKVADFGIARSMIRKPERGRETSGFVGTPAYASPEQARSEDADARSDLYALGLILYEMLAGEPAYPRESAFLTLKRRLDGPPPPIRGEFPKLGLAEGLEEALRRLLAHSPDDRPQDAAAARALLAPFDGSSGASHAAEPVEALGFPTVYRPLNFAPSLCGRDAELALCTPFVERLGEYAHAMVLVIAGAGGVGKSLVAARLAKLACAKRGARRYDKECSDTGQPLRELGEVIEDLLGTRGLEATLLEQRLTDLLADAHSAGVLLRLLRPSQVEDAAITHEAEAERNHQCQLVLDALACLAASRPLCIVLDDAQAANALTRAVIARVPLWSRDRGMGLLFIATWTTGSDSEPPAEAQRERFADRARVVRIEALSEEQSDALLRAMDLEDAEARKLIVKLSLGRPLFLVQMVRHLKNEELLIPTQRGWRLVPRARFDLSLPPAIEFLGARQIDQLRAREGAGALAADLLERMALVGDRAPLALLRRLLERENRSDLLDKIEVLLDLLVAEGIVQRIDTHVAFRHALMHQAIATRAAGRPDAATLHLAIADSLLASADDDAHSIRAAALHLFRGGAHDRALPLALRSAKLARSVGDTSRASEDYLLAHRILEAQKKPTKAKRLEVELGLGETLLRLGQTRQAEEHFMKALAMSATAAVHEGLGRVADLKGDFGLAKKYLSFAKRQHMAAGRAREAAEVSILLGHAFQCLGDLDSARERYQGALERFSELAEAQGVARAQTALGLLSAWTGNPVRGLDLLHEALPVLEAGGDPFRLGHCLCVVGDLSARMGQHAAAVDFFQRGRSQFERVGAAKYISSALQGTGTNRAYLGFHDEAERLIEAALRLSEDMEDGFGVAACLVNLGFACRLAGKLQESAQWLGSGLAHGRRLGARAVTTIARSELALTMLRSGALDQAEAEFQSILGDESPSVAELQGECWEGLGDISRARNDATGALKRYRKAFRQYQTTGHLARAAAVEEKLAMLRNRKTDT